MNKLNTLYKMKNFPSMFFCAIFSICLSIPTYAQGNAANADFEELCQWMQGSFNSEAQAQTDSSYYSINLEMHQIWSDRTDAFWIYVEQALSSKKEKPYRQRVYKVEQLENGFFSSTIYTLPNPENYIGQWNDNKLFSQITPDSLLLREGCAVILQKAVGIYTGSTTEDACTSTLRGATYATSEITITSEGIISWDRGFDAEDQQVWGAEKGGYIFESVKEAQTEKKKKTKKKKK